MRNVTKEKFFEFIGPQDVTLSSDYSKPVTTFFFRLRYGGILGKIIINRAGGVLTKEYYTVF